MCASDLHDHQVGNKETLKTSDIKQQTAETLHKIDKLLGEKKHRDHVL